MRLRQQTGEKQEVVLPGLKACKSLHSQTDLCESFVGSAPGDTFSALNGTEWQKQRTWGIWVAFTFHLAVHQHPADTAVLIKAMEGTAALIKAMEGISPHQAWQAHSW